MSGGEFDYKQYHINEIADAIQKLIESNNDTRSYLKIEI